MCVYVVWGRGVCVCVWRSCILQETTAARLLFFFKSDNCLRESSASITSD